MKKRLISKRVFSLFLTGALTVGTLFTGLPVEETQAATTSAEIYYGLSDEIQGANILHCFDWTFDQIKECLPEIAEAGFSAVQTSPAQAAVKGNSIWWYLYQPVGFRVGDSGLGSEEDLQELCAEADNYGVKVIVDVVANHLTTEWDSIDSDLQNSDYFHNGTSSINYNTRKEIVHGDIGLPDLNSENSYVQYKVQTYIQQLKADGVDGIRWDAAKHICLPTDECCSTFWTNVLDSDMYNYGEILDSCVANNSSYNLSLYQSYTDYMSVTDNNYSNNVCIAFTGGSVPTFYADLVINDGIDNDEVVYWAESHDTYSNNDNSSSGYFTNYVDQNVIDRAYAIIASRDGASALYFSRPSETYKNSIMVGVQGSTHFTSAEVAAVNHLSNNCSGEPDYYVYDTTANVCAVVRNTGAVIVLGSGSNQSVSVQNGGTGDGEAHMADGTYIDEVSGNTFTVADGVISGTVGSTGIAVIYKCKTVTPTISVDNASQTFTDSITVSYTISDADSYTILANGVENDSLTQTYTETTTVTVTATNTAGTTTKTYTYTKSEGDNPDDPDDPDTTMTIYLDTSACTWFGNDSAVAAYSTDSGSTYTEMSTVEIDSKTYYTAAISTDVTELTVVRMLPSGKYYNAFSFSVSASYNCYTTDSGLSSVSDSNIQTGGGNEDVTTITVYFSNNYGWSNVYAYTWGGSENTSSWPGDAMTYVETNKYGEKIYKIEIAADVTGLIFNNGSGTQTVDITSVSDGQGYYLTGSGSKLSVGTYTYGD